MRTYKITTFADARTTSGEQFELTLEQLAAKLTAVPRVNADRLSGEAFVPGWFDNASRASGSAFHAACCLVLDFDGAEHKALSDSELLSVVETLQTLNVTYVLYTTYRFGLRVVFPLSEDVSAKQYAELFDNVAQRFEVRPDKGARGASRLNFLPQVGRESDVERFTAEAQVTRPLMDSGLTGGRVESTFSGLKLSKVRVGSVDTLEALTAALATSTSKQEDLNRYVFGLAKAAAQRGQDKQAFADALWPAAQAGLQRNQNPVESWQLALNTCERAIKQAYEKHAEERAAQLAAIAPAQVKKVASLLNEGKVSEAGAVLGKYVSKALTVSDLVQECDTALEESAALYDKDDAVARLTRAISENARFSWQADLRLDPSQKGFAGSDVNIDVVLDKHPDVAGKLARNVRSVHERYYLGDMPWGSPAGEVREPKSDERLFLKWLTSNDVLGATASHMPAGRASGRLAEAFESAPSIDPFKLWLEGIVWDGQPRLSSFFAQCGGPDSESNSVAFRQQLIAACARADKPGTEVQVAVVLVGTQQGQGKSRFIKALVDDDYAGPITSFEHETPQRMSRWVIALIDEVERFASRKDSGALKEFVTTSATESRAKFVKYDKMFPRRAVLFCTTNHEKYLHDDTGARRWRSVVLDDDCQLDIDKLVSLREQVWAEAWHAYCAGEKWYLPSHEEQRLFGQKQEVLTRLEPSAAGEKLLALMDELPAPLRYFEGEATLDPASKVKVRRGQMAGNKMLYIFRSQMRDVLRLVGYNLDDHAVEQAWRSAGLRRGWNRHAKKFFRTVEEARNFEEVESSPEAEQAPAKRAGVFGSLLS